MVSFFFFPHPAPSTSFNVLAESPDGDEIPYIDVNEQDPFIKDAPQGLFILLANHSAGNRKLFRHNTPLSSVPTQLITPLSAASTSIRIDIHEQAILIEQPHGVVIGIYRIASRPYPHLIA